MSVNTTDPMIGRLIDGRYQVRSRIARGGMATVYLATDLRLERRVAVKVMHSHLADDAQFTQRFIQEARSAARLAHPNVVNVFDQGQDGESAYLVMEFLPGITLRELLQEYGSLTAEQAIDIIDAVLSGLAAAHKAGIVHRDLKPENVLLADDGRIKIGDFGLARAVTANTATGAALLGTIAYLSPELVTRGMADARSDIYAVGIMLFEMLTGEQPFVGDQPMQIAYQHAHENVPAPSGRKPEIPSVLDELVLGATARDPEDRPADARAMLEELREAESTLSITPTPARGRTALPTAAQRTMVLPASPRAEAETQVLGGAGAPVITPSPRTTDPQDELPASPAPRRRRRGGLIAAIVVVLLVLGAGGTAGWYFLLGPGAPITIPDLVNQSPASARATLEAQGFTVAADGQASSLTVAAGSVAATQPAGGTSVAQGSKVTLLVSTGPQQLDIKALKKGMSEADAKTAIAGKWNLTGDPQQYDSSVPKGALIDVLAADGSSLLGKSTYPEQGQLSFVVSAGAIPNVAGVPLDQAITKLTDAGLKASQGAVVYSDTVPKGDVIQIENISGKTLHPGDSVTLQVSNGPPLVVIPNVVRNGSWVQAKQKLSDAGFQIAFSNNTSKQLDASLPGLAYVSTITPNENTSAPKGSTVTVTLSAG